MLACSRWIGVKGPGTGMWNLTLVRKYQFQGHILPVQAYSLLVLQVLKRWTYILFPTGSRSTTPLYLPNAQVPAVPFYCNMGT